jgi:DNA-directed RNA polymerase specialized sigma subunit
MVTTRTHQKLELESLARTNVELADRIAGRLYRSYSWVDMDDLRSYAYLGLALAERAFRPELGVPFVKFAWRKAMFLAIDEMRKDGVVSRRESPRDRHTPLSFETPDPQSDASAQRLERDDLCDMLMGRLRDRDQQLV